MIISQESWLKVRRIFVSSYTELQLFLMAQSFLLLLIFNDQLRNGIKAIFDRAIRYQIRYQKGEIIWVLAVSVLVMSGLLLSIYHAFSSRRKSDLDKAFMLSFALCINGTTGIIAGLRVINGYHGVLLIFPALNIFNGLVLLYLMAAGDDSMIDDKHAPAPKLLLGSIVGVIAFFLCQSYFRLQWALTYSVCVAYSMNVSNILNNKNMAE